MTAEEDSRWKKRFERERKSRKEAETLLEKKALELFNANKTLLELNSNLEKIVIKRTDELKQLNASLEESIKVEIEKRRQNEQILVQQSKMIAMGEMVGNIAHQWRQPLNVISLIISDLIDVYEFEELDDEYMREFEDNMKSNISFMSDTIDDFRNFFRTSKEKHIFSLKDVVDEVIKLYFQKKLEIAIELNYDSDNLESLNINSYKNEFKQVILNLINNAKDALIEHSIEDKQITINMYGDSDTVSIEIEDNGGGIPSDILEKIFEPYFTTKGENVGTGIGLYMSKTIIEVNMGGKISVENREKGARFTIKLFK